MKDLFSNICARLEEAPAFSGLSGVEISRSILSSMELKDPGIPFVHIAGTNGKGSVSAFLSSILKEAGYRVGTLTSPHLIHWTERIRVDGKPISPECFGELGTLVYKKAEELSLSPTPSDILLAMALLYFKEQDCSMMILETGLGGRLDSTNAVGVPAVSVITHIGMDHTGILGDDILDIALEKSGIIKTGSHLVMGDNLPEVRKVLVQVADEKNVSYVDCHDKIPSLDNCLSHASLRMEGAYQKENAKTAMAAAWWILKDTYSGDPLDKILHDGVSKATWPGRMQVLSERPFVLVDGAHNVLGVRALCNSLKERFPNQKLHFITGICEDKDIKGMILSASGMADCMDTVGIKSYRGMDPEKLSHMITERTGVSSRAYENVDTLLQEEFLRTGAATFGTKEPPVVIFGSLYLIGEVLEKWAP